MSQSDHHSLNRFLLLHVYISNLRRFVCLIACLAVFLPTTASAQQIEILDRVSAEQALALYRDCGLRKIDEDQFVERMPERAKADPRRKNTATITVSYSSNFPGEARQAFTRAIDIWESRIASPITIEIDARWRDLGTGTLGAAGPFFALVDTDGNGSSDTILGFPLLDAVTEQDQFPDNPDIVAQFNSTRDDWHFGQDPAPPGQIDFTSVVLHEITHGLNYVDYFNYSSDSGQGGYGFDFDGNGQIDEDERAPGAYARQTVLRQSDGTLASLTNESVFPNPSRSIGDALTSNRLFFQGETANRGARQGSGPVPPKLYAPPFFQGGSSIAHLDEATYPSETPNALMTPQIGSAETNRMPGPVVCGQLQDMGWPLGPDCNRYFPPVFAFQGQPTETADGIQLSWRVDEGADVEEYVFERQYFDEGFEVVRRVDPSAVPDQTVTFSDLGLGVFSFRLRWIQSDGTERQVPTPVRDTINIQNFSEQRSDPDEQGRQSVTLSWEEPPGTEGFRYQIQRKRGTEGSFRTVATRQQTSYTDEQQTPGRYRYRVRAEDASGNAVEGPTKPVQIDFEGSVYTLGPYPNPVQNTATIDLTAREAQPVTVEVYDANGKRIYAERRELRKRTPAVLTIDTSGWASGMYFLRVRGEEFTKTRKMVVVQ